MKILNRFLALIIISSALISSPLTLASGGEDLSYKHTKEQILKATEKAVDYTKENYGNGEILFTGDFLQNAGSVVGDWYAIALNRLGFCDDYNAYLNALKDNVTERYKDEERLSSQKATEWHRISLAVISCGGNPQDIGGINLINDGVFNRGLDVPLDKQGINGCIWALITADSLNFAEPNNCFDTREKIINKILSSQLSDGSYSVDGENPDTDITAMAVTSLSPYCKDNKTVSKSVNNALDYLQKAQNDNGGFSSTDGENCESTAQVLIALCSMGVAVETDSRFIKNGNTIIDRLLSYQNADGGFCHIKDGESEQISTQQALCGLASYYRFLNKMKTLYDFSDLQVNQKSVDIKSLLSSASDIIKKSENTKSTAYLTAVNSLISSLKNESFENKEEIINALLEIQRSCMNLQKQINSLNKEIESLMPLDNVTLSQKDKIDSLFEKAESFSDYDKAKISCFEQLKKAHVKLLTQERTIIITVVFSVVLILLLIFIFTNIKRIKNKKKNKMQELIKMYEDED